MPNAERVWIESDERGFELWIETDEDEPVCFNIQNIDLDTFYDQVKGRIGPYLQERDQAKRTFVAQGGYARGFFACNPDESGGRLTDAGYENPRHYDQPGSAYALDDPKHPDYHDAMSDLWDSREGK